jgi:hypothetical protein
MIQIRLVKMILSIALLFIIGEANSLKADQAINDNIIPLYKTKTVSASSSIGPFELADKENNSKIKFQFASQLWLYYESRDNGSGKDRTTGLYMKARRIRLTLQGDIIDPNLSFKLHLSTAPKSLELMDLYFNYKLDNRLQFRFGQYKVPFTRYRIQSFQRLVFIDWAITTQYFGAERQMGFAFHNGYEKPLAWGYEIGMFTGVNARASHAIGLPKVYAEEIVNPSDLVDSGPTAEFHPELFLHISRNANNIQVQLSTDAERGDLRYSIGMSAAWDMDPTEFQDFRYRFAPEFLVKYQGVSLSGTGYAGYSDVNEPSQTELTMLGGLVQTSYRIDKSYEVCLRYAVVDFRDVLTDYAKARAQQLIEDSGNDPDVIKQYQNAGIVNREEEITLGFNKYIIEHFLKWQIDFGRLKHLRDTETRNDYLIRSQFQLTF